LTVRQEALEGVEHATDTRNGMDEQRDAERKTRRPVLLSTVNASWNPVEGQGQVPVDRHAEVQERTPVTVFFEENIQQGTQLLEWNE